MYTFLATNLRRHGYRSTLAALILLIATPALGQLLTPVIQYQGRLLNPANGVPINAAVDISFHLYDGPSALVPLWSEAQTVTPVDGLFSVLLGDSVALPGSIFDGNNLWLGLQVGSDAEAVPRQPIIASPYAHYADNATLLAGKQASDFAAASHTHGAAEITSGTVDEARIPASIARTIDVFNEVLSNDGPGSNLDADTLDGIDSVDFAPATHNHDAEYVNTTGPDSISAASSDPALSITQTGTGGAARFEADSDNSIYAQLNSPVSYEAAVQAVAGTASGVYVSGSYAIVGDSTDSHGVVGISRNGFGLFGYSMTSQAIRGEAGAGYGVEGITWGTNTAGVAGLSYGTTSTGVLGSTAKTDGTGVTGEATAGTGATTGVRSLVNSVTGTAVSAQSTAVTGSNYGVRAFHASSTGGAAVRGESDGWVGVWGVSAGRWGVYGQANADSSSYGVYGSQGGTTGSYAGYFSGNLNVTGTLSKGAGSFKIDHPLDPENKYLSHSFVESPDMMNVYNGNARLDAAGEAWVELPEWFEALNRDFRYQLTPLGASAPNLYIAEEITGNRFKIAGGPPNGRVSWLVTGVRHDAYANAHRIPVEEKKDELEKGHYLHPDAFGLKSAVSIGDLNGPETAASEAGER